MIKRKKGLVGLSYLVAWLIGILVLIASLVLAWKLYYKNLSALEFLRNIFRFGR